MKRTAIFVDHENLRIAAQNRGVGIDWYSFKEYLASEQEGRYPLEALCYVAVDPRNEHAKDGEIDRLWEDGWLVRKKTGAPAGIGKYKCNVDVEMAMDIVFFANDVKPDIVVLVSGDQDFAPVAIKLRERGIRVEVAAFPESISKVLLDAASGYINLETWVAGIRSGDAEEALPEREPEPEYDESEDEKPLRGLEAMEGEDRGETAGANREIPNSGRYLSDVGDDDL